MAWALAADVVALAHLLFVLFAALGAVLALRWPRLAWLQLPCALWAAAVELADWPCPLTPLESWLRLRAGEGALGGGFIEHYVSLLLYPPGLTRTVQIVLGGLVLGFNALIYICIVRKRRRG